MDGTMRKDIVSMRMPRLLSAVLRVSCCVSRLHSLVLWICLIMLLSTRVYAQGVLTDDQIEQMKTRWLDAKKKKRYLFYGEFSQQKLDPNHARQNSQIQIYKRTGKVPFRLWAEFGEIWEFQSGRNRPEMLVGQPLYYYIKDDKGNVVKKDSLNVGRTAKKGESGGVFADLPKEGIYTCVVYVKKEGMLFGEQYTVTFNGYK